ncbi:hypothetical protein ACSV5M_16455 [Cellvibrio sp. ARAG 10.3]|uniref:hypothetical protein n=1 Tax=Cellvibrio sp. ARAG 10.3 TaxID=3451358 RepID=UPI003F4601BE
MLLSLLVFIDCPEYFSGRLKQKDSAVIFWATVAPFYFFSLRILVVIFLLIK